MITNFKLFLESKSEKTKKGKKVPAKYLTKNKENMKDEIDKFRGSDKYKQKWKADYKSGNISGERYKTETGKATKKYKEMYGE